MATQVACDAAEENEAPMSLKKLTIEALCQEARTFADVESKHSEPCLFGVTDGKAVGTYLEHKFRQHLSESYAFALGNSASGIDFPGINVDMKVTSAKQPQSSCPFKSARQKVFGLGYSLLVFVYDKSDDQATGTGRLTILHAILVDQALTGDYQTTSGLQQILDNSGNLEDMAAFMRDRNLPLDDIQANEIAEEVMKNGIKVGYLTISNALQWRLQYARAIVHAGSVKGIARL